MLTFIQKNEPMLNRVGQLIIFNQFSRNIFVIFFLLSCINCTAQVYEKGNLLYSNPLAIERDTAGWIMEGFGKIELKDNKLYMYSPSEEGHHVYWCPIDFPEDFIAEWEVQNLHTEVGLCIVFFASKGLNNEDIFSTFLPKRNGTFKNYTNGAINNYHISYYSNSKDHPGRETAHLRKNSGFHLIQSQYPGIPIKSLDLHKIKLLKYKGHIQLFIDNRITIDWQDDGQKFGKILTDGKIGFRQMKWTHFTYSNFNVWECISNK